MGDPQSLVTTSAALSAFRVPVVSVSPSFYSDIGEYLSFPERRTLFNLMHYIDGLENKYAARFSTIWIA